MNKEFYEKITEPIRKNSNGRKVINFINNFFTKLVYLTYPIFLFKLVLDRDIRFWRLFLVPGISFVLVSIFRKIIDFPRPYEVLDIHPLISKDTKGNSFPSRHVFSVFVIAMSIYYISSYIGILLMLIGVVIATVRVLGGVHFPRDVIAGAIIGILSGVIGWNYIIF